MIDTPSRDLLADARAFAGRVRGLTAVLKEADRQLHPTPWDAFPREWARDGWFDVARCAGQDVMVKANDRKSGPLQAPPIAVIRNRLPEVIEVLPAALDLIDGLAKEVERLKDHYRRLLDVKNQRIKELEDSKGYW